MMYSISTIRRKAYAIGYQVTKGCLHFQDFVYHDSYGNRFSGYMVMDLKTGFYEWGSYNENFSFRWNLDDVVEFLKGEYEARGLKW